MNQDYKNEIKKVVKNLVSLRHETFGLALNLAMKGELEEINEVFEINETYEFSLEHLDKSSDANLQLLVDLIKKIERTAESIANLNKIEIEDYLK